MNETKWTIPLTFTMVVDSPMVKKHAPFGFPPTSINVLKFGFIFPTRFLQLDMSTRVLHITWWIR